MKSSQRFTLIASEFLHRKRILLVVLLAVSILSIVAITSRDGARAYHAVIASPVPQSGFVITSPTAGSLVPCGQPITVTWAGGEPSDNVNVVLIDVQAFQVFQGFGVEPNTGSRVVTIGPGSCGRTSQFYVEDSPRTTWTYGPVFNVGCASVNIANGDVAGLIAAINSANVSGCSTTVNLAPNGTYTLTAVADNGDPDLYQASGAAGLPYIRTPITINGNGATIQRSAATGTPDFGIFSVSGAGPYRGNLSLNGVTLIGGSLGALNLAYGTAFIQNTTVTQNSGGGINTICGSLTMVNSTVSYNTSDSAWGGGGIFLWGFACAQGYPVANISFSTIFENSNPGWGRGNAIGTAYVGSPGGVFLKNSILASPSHPSEAVCNNGAGTLYSLGHNILGDTADVFGSRCDSALTAPGDMVNTNPLLGPLANNGGMTPTHLPQCNSPAIDAVPVEDSTAVNSVPITTDQRGISRPQQSACDIGSVELVNATHGTKLFAVSSQGEESTNEVFRYQLGPTGSPTLDLTMTHGSFDRPFGITFNAAGEMFIVNRGSGGGGGGSVSRFVNAGQSPLFNGAVLSSSFDTPHDAAFRNGELFISQRFGAGALRFLFDGADNGSLNGTITNGLNPGFPRGVTVNPTTGELFISECCGVNEINRYVFDASGNAIPNGVITGGGLSNPHAMAFSPWGELFVANVDGNISRFVFDDSGNAISNGQLSGNGLCGPIGLAFSPWGELFVANHFCPRIARWTFDASFNAIPNGSFSTPATLGDLEFLPGTEIHISCARALTAPANTDCLAPVPNVLSDITSSSDCGGSVTLSQSPTAGTLVNLGTTTITVTASDAAHNSSSCTTTFTVTDVTPPTITITTPPSGAAYLLNQSVAASYSCADCGGVASCVGPVASGSSIGTASVGTKAFTVSASDNASNNAAPQSVSYTVSYGVAVLFDQNRAAKSGSTIPIKIQLVDANGNNVSLPAVVAHAVSVIQTSSSASVLLDDAGQANPDFDFRYDSSLGGTGGYIFNLKTTGYGTGTYVLNYTVSGDPVIHTIQFQVRQ
ncbi:MAG: choice-of-anchor Q domain-containing protein [Pyrinomonadaceae bacterium]